MFKILILLGILVVNAPLSRAQDEYVYLVKMFGCAHSPTERSQTGFRVRGLKGLVTALHGVADCQKVTASSRKGLFLDQPLTLVKIDVDHDVALLSSPQLDASGSDGLEVSGRVIWQSLESVTAFGHPYGISSLETTLTLRNPPLTPLKDLVPADPLSVLKERRSPNHLINVLSLQGNLLPGHSGAPILDTENRVIGIANGGLKEGFAGISWAIPFKDIDWDSPSSGGRLKALAKLDPNILFAADATHIDDPPNEFCAQLSKVITASRTGFISIVGDSFGKDIVGNFKSNVDIPGSDFNVVQPPRSAQYQMYGANEIGTVDRQFYSLATRLSACLPGWEQKEYLDKYRPAWPWYKHYVLREQKGGPTVEAEMSLFLHPPQLNKYYLQLKIYSPGQREW
jgi:hypothetical protein